MPGIVDNNEATYLVAGSKLERLQQIWPAILFPGIWGFTAAVGLIEVGDLAVLSADLFAMIYPLFVVRVVRSRSYVKGQRLFLENFLYRGIIPLSLVESVGYSLTVPERRFPMWLGSRLRFGRGNVRLAGRMFNIDSVFVGPEVGMAESSCLKDLEQLVDESRAGDLVELLEPLNANHWILRWAPYLWVVITALIMTWPVFVIVGPFGLAASAMLVLDAVMLICVIWRFPSVAASTVLPGYLVIANVLTSRLVEPTSIQFRLRRSSLLFSAWVLSVEGPSGFRVKALASAGFDRGDMQRKLDLVLGLERERLESAYVG